MASEHDPAVDIGAAHRLSIKRLTASERDVRLMGASDMLAMNQAWHKDAGDGDLHPGLSEDQLHDLETDIQKISYEEPIGNTNNLTRKALVAVGQVALHRRTPDLVTGENVLRRMSRPGIKWRISRYLLNQTYQSALTEAFDPYKSNK